MTDHSWNMWFVSLVLSNFIHLTQIYWLECNKLIRFESFDQHVVYTIYCTAARILVSNVFSSVLGLIKKTSLWRWWLCQQLFHKHSQPEFANIQIHSRSYEVVEKNVISTDFSKWYLVLRHQPILLLRSFHKTVNVWLCVEVSWSTCFLWMILYKHHTKKKAHKIEPGEQCDDSGQ